MSEGRRTAGDVYIKSSATVPVYTADARAPAFTNVAADATTSGGVAILSANTTGATYFACTNSGSINIYIEGSFNGVFFQPSVQCVRAGQAGGAGGLTSTVECVSASTCVTFGGPYQIVRVVANSGSGVYRAALTYR